MLGCFTACPPCRRQKLQRPPYLRSCRPPSLFWAAPAGWGPPRCWSADCERSCAGWRWTCSRFPPGSWHRSAPADPTCSWGSRHPGWWSWSPDQTRRPPTAKWDGDRWRMWKKIRHLFFIFIVGVMGVRFSHLSLSPFCFFFLNTERWKRNAVKWHGRESIVCSWFCDSALGQRFLQIGTKLKRLWTLCLLKVVFKTIKSGESLLSIFPQKQRTPRDAAGAI